MDQFIRQRPAWGQYDYHIDTHIIIKYNERAVKRHASSAEVALGRFDDILNELSGMQELVFVNAKQGEKGEVREVALSFRGKAVVAILEPHDKDKYVYRLRRFEPVTIDAFSEEEQYKKELTGYVAFLSQEKSLLDYLADNNLSSRSIIDGYEALRQEVFSLKAPFRVQEASRMRKVWLAYINGARELLEDKRLPIVVKSVRYKNSDKGRAALVEIDLNETRRLERTELKSILTRYRATITSNEGDITVSFPSYTKLSEQTIVDLNRWCDGYHYAQEGIHHRLVGEIELSSYDEILLATQAALTEELEQFGIAHQWNTTDDEKGARLNVTDNTPLSRVGQVYEALRSNNKVFTEIELRREVDSLVVPIKAMRVPGRVENYFKTVDRNCRIVLTQGHIVVTTRRPLRKETLEEIEGVTIQQLRATYTLDGDLSQLEGLDNGITQDERNPRRWIASIPLDNLGKAGYYYGVIKEQATSVQSEYNYLFTLSLKEDLQDLRLRLSSDSINVHVPSSSVEFLPKSEQDLSATLRMVSEALPSYLGVDTEGVDVSCREYYRLFPVASLERQVQSEWNRLKNKLVDLNPREGSQIIPNEDKLSIRLELAFAEDDEREVLLERVETLVGEFDSAKIYWSNHLGETSFSLLYDEGAAIEHDKQLEKESRLEEVSLKQIEEQEYTYYVKGGRGQQATGVKEVPKYSAIGLCLKRSASHLEIKLNNVDTELKSGDVLCFRYQGEATNIDRQLAAMSSISGDTYKTTWGRHIDPIALVNPKLKDFIFDPRCAEEIDFADSHVFGVNCLENAARYIKETAIEKNINQKQCEAVARSLWAKDISIIQGPPGTGKTTVIAEIIYQEIKRNPECRILLTSQTNLAVDNALERLKGKANIRPIRIMRKEKSDRSDGAIYMEDTMKKWVAGDEVDCVLSHWIEKIHNKCQNSSVYSKYHEVLAPYLASLKVSDEHLRREFYEMYRNGINLVAATCSICGNERLFRDACRSLYGQRDGANISFDVVIIDEASKATPLELAIPMVLGKKIILIGDHKQLPAMLSREEVEDALEKTRKISSQEDMQLMMDNPQFKYMFEMAQHYQPSILSSLDTQYRMHNDIMQTVSHIYKDDIVGGLQCGIKEGMNDANILGNRASRYHGLTAEPLLAPDIHAVWVDSTIEERREGTSYSNEGEVRVIERVLERLQSSEGFEAYQATRQTREEQEIAVITFYGAQAGALERHLRGKFPQLNLRVDVVDNFQGMERDIVIVSTVRSNNRGNLGFAKAIERINVAFSRARRLLIVVGNKELFSRHEVYRTSISKMHLVPSQML